MKQFLLILLVAFAFVSGCSENEDQESLKENKILVLMYHRLAEGKAANLYERSVADFEADLKYIVEKNIKVIGFDDIEDVAHSPKIPYGNFVVLTFDDGDRSWYTLVVPLLKKYKMEATFFLWTNMIGHDSFLTWKEVESMSHYYNESGIMPFKFGSHTYTHAYLLQRKAGYKTVDEYNSFLDYELRESKKIIEGHIPADVSVLSLPFGDGAEDADIIAAAKRNGYRFIRTSVWSAVNNRAVNLFAIPALPVLDSTTAGEIGSYFDL